MPKRVFKLFRSLRKKKQSIATSEDTHLADYVKGLIGEPARDLSLYKQAFTHRSFPERKRGYDNERLEFLGDSVLSCIVSSLLYNMYEEYDEGRLTHLRSMVVSRNSLNTLALKLHLDKMLRISSGVNLKQSDALGNSLEALIGAIFLDKGFAFAQSFVRRHIVISKHHLKQISDRIEDYKTEFIILMQQRKVPFEFRHLDTLPDTGNGIVHRSEIVIGKDKRCLSVGVGTSKKTSHQNAAKDGLRILRKTPQILDGLKIS